MTTLTPADIYRAARAAGFDVANAVRATAIALAESGGRTNARGDLGLQTSKWGPSVGLMQIRTLTADTGTGRARDITRLDDPVANMRAAYEISSAGRDWTPWSTYKNGRWQQYLKQATAGAGQAGTGATTTGGGYTVQPAALGGLFDGGKVLAWATRALFVVLGLALVGVGVGKATR